MSNISCERQEKENKKKNERQNEQINKTQDNEIKDLKLNRRGEKKENVVFFAGDDRCNLCTGRKKKNNEKRRRKKFRKLYNINCSFLL